MSIAVATVAAFLSGGAYYTVLGPDADERMPPWKLAVEIQVGFPFVLWTGAVIHENTPISLAALHAGDWWVKLLLIGVIVVVLQ